MGQLDTKTSTPEPWTLNPEHPNEAEHPRKQASGKISSKRRETQVGQKNEKTTSN